MIKNDIRLLTCNNLYLLYIYILRFSHQILLCGKAFQIFLWPIRAAKRVFHEWKNPFTSLIGRSKIRNAFSQSKIWYENLSMYKINKLQHGKHLVRDFHTSWWSIRNFTCSLRSLMFDFRYLSNSCENPIHARFPWSNLYVNNALSITSNKMQLQHKTFAGVL